MFISNLNNDQQGKLHTLTQMLVHTENAAKQQPYVSDTGLNTTVLLELEDSFTTQEAKVSLLLELMSAAYQHQTDHVDNYGIIQAIAWKLNIPSQLLQDMEYWVELQSILTKEAKMLMSEPTCH